MPKSDSYKGRILFQFMVLDDLGLGGHIDLASCNGHLAGRVLSQYRTS